MNNENKIIPNMKKEDEDEYEYEYVLELEKFNNCPKQKNFVTCYKENKSIKPVKPQVIQSQIVNSKNKT